VLRERIEGLTRQKAELGIYLESAGKSDITALRL
jgi:hypothetical protein